MVFWPILTNNSVASMSSFLSAAVSSGSLSESISVDFFSFRAGFFSLSLPDESLAICLFLFSAPIFDSAEGLRADFGVALRLRLPDLRDPLRLRLPDLCDALRLRLRDFCDALRLRLPEWCEALPLRLRDLCEPLRLRLWLRLWLPDLCDALWFDWCEPDRFEWCDWAEWCEPLPDRFECCEGLRLRDLCECCDPSAEGDRLPREWLALREWDRERLVCEAGVCERDLELLKICGNWVAEKYKHNLKFELFVSNAVLTVFDYHLRLHRLQNDLESRFDFLLNPILNQSLQWKFQCKKICFGRHNRNAK